MAFTECLAYAGDKFRELTGESRPRPSTGMYPGEYWKNAQYTTSIPKAIGVAIWVNSNSTDEGHALCIESYNPNTKKYHCHEANWDLKGNTREIDLTSTQIQSTLYPNKIFKGTVY